MLWRSLCPGMAVLWYFLPWLIFVLPYQSFFLGHEWFLVTLRLATVGFNSSVLLLAPRSRNLWSWFGRLLAFMMECSTRLELCISMCSHVIMKESWNGMASRWNSSRHPPCPTFKCSGSPRFHIQVPLLKVLIKAQVPQGFTLEKFRFPKVPHKGSTLKSTT